MGYIKRHYQYNNFDDEKVSLRLEGERLWTTPNNFGNSKDAQIYIACTASPDPRLKRILIIVHGFGNIHGYRKLNLAP